jgi:hypothetical protein
MKLEKPICIIEVNENLRRVRLGEELTRPLRELQLNCKFKQKYDEWCDIEQGIEKFIPKILICPVCNKKFKQKKYFQKICSKKKCRLAKQREYYRTHPE